jgi:hypothetical protein
MNADAKKTVLAQSLRDLRPTADDLRERSAATVNWVTIAFAPPLVVAGPDRLGRLQTIKTARPSPSTCWRDQRP